MAPFDELIPGEPVKVSASTFATWLQCPAAAEARLQGVYGPDTRPAFSGQLAHRIFARHLEDGTIDPGEFEQACRREIGASTLNAKLASLGMRPSELRSVIGEVGALYERFKRFPTEGFKGAEHAIEQEPGGDVTLIGSIDAVYDGEHGARLIDWKTGNLGDPVPQLHFYAMLWWLEHGEVPAEVAAISVRSGEQMTEVPSREQLEETVAGVAGMVEAVRRAWQTGGALERRGGPWCGYCPLLDGCEEGAAAVKAGPGRRSVEPSGAPGGSV